MEETTIAEPANNEESLITPETSENDATGGENPPAKSAQPIGDTTQRNTFITIDGKNYPVTEDKIKQFYGIEGEPLTDREWKTLVSSYKAHVNGDLKAKKVDKQDKLIYEVADMLQHNPKELLKRAGYDLRKFSEEVLSEMIEEEMLPEAERELRKTRREKELLEKQIEEQKQAQLAEQEAILTQQAQQELTQNIIEALEENKRLPKSPDVVRRIAYYMLKGIEKGIPLNPKQIIPMVEQDIRELQSSILDSLDPNNLLEFIGEERLKKIRQADLQRVKGQPNFVGSKGVVKQEAPKTEKRLSKEEWRQLIKQRVSA